MNNQSDWVNAIEQMSANAKQTVYYRKDDEKHKKRYFVTGTATDFEDTNKRYVIFYSPQDEESAPYLLDINSFAEQFIADEK